MASYYDAELLKENFAKRLNDRFGILIKIDDAAVELCLAIDDTPTADVVEVVRCHECKSYNGHRYCEYFASTVFDVDFCSC